jgi:hypothetical protein
LKAKSSLQRHFQVFDLEVLQITNHAYSDMADLRVENITYLQGVSRLNQNELELEVSASQMR